LGSLPDEYQSLDGVSCISGCSIGGILAGAYAIGRKYSEIDELFQARAADCFKKRLAARLNPLACPTYSNDGLKSMLKEVFGRKTIGQVGERYKDLMLFVPTLNITDDKYKVFDNLSPADADIKLSTIGLMTSAAPSYFEGVPFHGKCMIDGGLVEVAPLMTAVTGFKAKKGVPFEDMDVLMIGTGKDVSDKPVNTKEYNGYSLLGIAANVVLPYVTFANELATCYWGNLMGFNSFTFFNPCKHNGQLDDVDQIPDMVKQSDKYLKEFTDIYTEWLNK
jgi:patatin-like phospholipase/acyl hydrolase